jgi:hypothetical protein
MLPVIPNNWGANRRGEFYTPSPENARAGLEKNIMNK